MSGSSELKVEERLTEAELVLEEYSKSIGTKSIKYNKEVESILEMQQTELRKLGEEELNVYSYTLSQYALFLQKEVNRHNAKMRWANHNLDIVMGKLQGNYGDKYTKWEVKKIMVCNDNDLAKALNKIILEASMRIEELAFLSSRISTLSTILTELSKSKRSSRYDR